MKTLEEIKELLAERFDEQLLLEILDVNSYDLVNRFEDLIETRIDYFTELVEDTEEIGEEYET